MVEVYTRYITVRGKRLDAHDYGKKAWHFFVTEQKHEEYLKKQSK